MRTIQVTWLAMLVAVAVVAARRCTTTPPDAHVAMSDSMRDSLLAVNVPGTQRVDYEGFSVWFSAARHLAACVTYELIGHELDGTLRRLDAFDRDPRVDGCPAPEAYAGTGLHRGHLAPAGDMAWSAKAMQQSFLMTNVCPQHRTLNEGGWARLEEKCREWTRRDSALIIATGPVLPANLDTIAGSGVAIPQQFYKVILAPCVRPMRAIAFLYDNGPCNGPLERYAVSVDEVERLTGIDFFAALPPQEQERIESACNLQVWLH